MTFPGYPLSMNCREFKSKHVGFVDDLLSAVEMAGMRGHLRVCPPCAALDVRIRRSLLVIRNLPQIEPSPDFYFRLIERLQHAPAPATTQQRSSATTLLVATAALAAAVYFAVAGGAPRTAPAAPVSGAAQLAVNASTPVAVPPVIEANISAAVPAGVPVWPAMMMVADLPTRLTTAELVENGIAR
jgi:hypothetical protein